jgi:ABC-2 type transport system ATP-binding protein
VAADSSQLLIELKNVRKRFGERTAVDDVSLTVPKGEIYGLLGHNGAGKSTAIGMMLGMVWPTGGVVRVCGYEVSTHRSHALEKVGAIFETPAFYDYLSGLRNLQILSSYTAPVKRSRIDEVVDWVGLRGREHSKVRTYSHGMRARLALAQALLPNPELLILDEPSNGLDPEGIHEMRQVILRLHRDLRLTILLSSHLLHEIEQLCTRIAVLNAGRLVFEGLLSETRQREQWARLKVGDFGVAVEKLRQAGLVTDSQGGELVALSPGAATDQIVRLLVGQGMPVYEIAHSQQSLENFYLELMNAPKQKQ